MSTTLNAAARPTSAPKNRLARPLTVVAAAAAATAVWAVEVPALGVHLAVRSGTSTSTVAPAMVVAVSLLVGLAAWGLLALLERTLTRGRLVWTAVAAVLLISLAGPLGGLTGAAKVALACLHLTVGLILIVGLRRVSPPSARR